MVNVTFKAVHSQASANWTCVQTPHKAGSASQDHPTHPFTHTDQEHSVGSSADQTRTAVINVANGDNIHCSNYQFGGQRRVTLYANGKQVATSQASHGGWVNYTVKLSEIPFGGIQNGTPTYLETLDKLDQWTSAHYVPRAEGSRDGQRRNELNL